MNSAAERDLAHGAAAGIDEAHMLRRQGLADLLGKVADRHRLRQRADAAEALGLATLFLLRDDEARELREADGLSEHIVDAAAGDVEIRVGCGHGNVVLQQHLQAMAERLIRADLLDGLEEQRVVRDNHLRPLAHGLAHDRVADVERDEDAADLPIRAADEQARVIPILCEMIRRDALQRIHDNLTFHHDRCSPNSLIWRTTA